MPRRPRHLPRLAVGLATSLAAALLVPLAPVGLGGQEVAVAPATAPACAATSSAGPLALVLPGGGVRGMAHVGVIQVLDSLGVVPDMIVGTSMGAIVGALYASGYSGEEIERLTRRWAVGAYIGRYAPRAPRALGPQPPLLLWEEGEGGVLDLETAAVQEGRINALLSALMLRGNLLARGDFDRLPIPFRAVATDLRTGGRVTLARGDLAEAVRASFGIPLVFDPVPMDGRTLVDGGLAENVPVRTARELGAARVLLSGLTLQRTSALPRTPEMAGRLVEMLFDHGHPPLGTGDVELVSRVDDAANLDFRDSTVRQMIARGRAAAQAALTPAIVACLTSGRAVVRDSAGRLVRAAPPVPALARPLLAAGTPGRARHFVEKTLGAREGGTIGFDTLQSRLARLGEVEAVRAAWLHPRAAGDAGDSVQLAPDVQLAPRRAVGAGLAYDNDLGGRAWAGLVDRRLAGKPIEAAVRGVGGQWRQEVALELRKGIEDVRDARSPFALVVLSREDVRLFDERGVDRPRTDLPRVGERLAMAGVDVPGGTWLELRVAALVRQWRNDREGVAMPAPDATEAATASGLTVRLQATGERTAVRLESEWTQRYVRALLTGRRTLGPGRWQAAGTVRLGIVGREAPLTAWLPLGGSDGFAGMRVGERLGRAEASATLDASRAVLGPLRVHLTLMGGQTSLEPRRPLEGTWLGGARLGLGAETPIGPVRAQYGVNGDKRSQWFLRVGRWF